MTTRNNNFALLHYVAAYMVILGHMFVLCGKTVPVTLNSNIHELGVNILFVISGYLVAKSFMRCPSVKVFGIKRLARIYPALAVCVVLCAAVGYILSDLPLAAYLPGAKAYVTGNLLMRPQFHLPGVFMDNPYPVAVNGSLWTLPIELFCFLLLPCYLHLIEGVKHKVTVCFVVAAAMSSLGIYVNQYCVGEQLVFWATDWLQAIRLGAYFLWGVAFSVLSGEQIRKWCRGDVAVLLLCAALCLGNCYLSKYNYFILPYLVISFAFSGEGIFRDFLNKHDYVYGPYLWAFPVQQTLIYFFRQKLPSVLLLFALSVAVTLLLAMLTNKLIEEPIAKITKWLAK